MVGSPVEKRNGSAVGLPIFDIRCSCQLVNLNIQVGVAARNFEFGDNLANFDSSCTADGRCSCQLVNLNIQVGVGARNIKFGNNLANFDSSCTAVGRYVGDLKCSRQSKELSL